MREPLNWSLVIRVELRRSPSGKELAASFHITSVLTVQFDAGRAITETMPQGLSKNIRSAGA